MIITADDGRVEGDEPQMELRPSQIILAVAGPDFGRAAERLHLAPRVKFCRFDLSRSDRVRLFRKERRKTLWTPAGFSSRRRADCWQGSTGLHHARWPRRTGGGLRIGFT